MKQSYSWFEVTHMLKKGMNIIFVDIREYKLYRQGHVPNAIWINYKCMSMNEIREKIGSCDLAIMYCSSGVESIYATARMRRCGICVASLSGGYRQYEKDCKCYGNLMDM